MTDLPWKTAWIIGASSGIGRATALRLAAAGVHVAASARNASALADLAAEAARAGGAISVHPLDITTDGAVGAALADIEAAHGPVDLALLSAGIWKQIDIGAIDVAAFRSSIEVNYLGAVNAIAALLPGMQARKAGQIAIISSVAGYFGLPISAAYGPTKAALINLAEALKIELDGSGVTVSLVNPGFVETRLTGKNDFPMPFIMTPDAAAARMIGGLARGGFEVSFPRRFVLLLKTLRLLPYPVFFWFIVKFVRPTR